MDFDKLADQQGWSRLTCGAMALRYIAQAGLWHEFSQWAQDIADDENERAKTADEESGGRNVT